MEYEKMNTIELKQIAKQRRVKQYYIKKRAELIDILQHGDEGNLSMTFQIDKLTIHQLRNQAKERGFKKFYTLKRHELVELLYSELYGGTQQNNKDNNSTDKHDDPDSKNSKEVRVEILENLGNDGLQD
jgi:hypothetical protein